MKFDWYAELGSLSACPTNGPMPWGLASGFVDGCAAWSAVNQVRAADCEARLQSVADEKTTKRLQRRQREHDRAKINADRCYMQRARELTLQLPSGLGLDSWPPQLLHADWLALAVDFELLTPWYSKDDRPFHVLDNPVRKDRVFGVPFMSAASWKGLLRWSCRMQEGLLDHLNAHRGKMDGRKDSHWIVHLFGNEKGEERKSQHGALVFYPTWFNKIGFEVINPHDRARRAGTQPIYYEVVPPGAEGTLQLLYAPLPPARSKGDVDRVEAIKSLLDAMEALLTKYGFSAKRTAGWGTAKISNWRAWRKDQAPIEAASKSDLVNQLFPGVEGTR